MPSLIWVPSGAADKKDIIIPLDNFFKRMNVRHVKNEVVGLKDILPASISLSLSRIFSTLLNPSQGIMAFSIPGNFLIKCPPEAIINASLSTEPYANKTKP
jgi:sulfide:quinone oxidoreductase